MTCHVRVYNDHAEYSAAVQGYAQREGCTSFSCNDPQCGQIGVLVNDSQNQETWLKYNLFGKTLTPICRQVSAEEIVETLRADEANAHICDNPKQLLLGFVWYDLEKGTATCLQTRLVQVKNLEPKDKAYFIDLHQALLAIRSSGSLNF